MGATTSKWKVQLAIDDPRNLRMRRSTRLILIVALTIAVAIALYVLTVVPWDTTLELRQRNSGEPFGLPIFAILIWPLAYVGLLILVLREEPKPIPYWEYSIGRWIIPLLMLPFMAGLLIWGLGFLEAAGRYPYGQ